jgi:DNA-binding PadR family transcriptional regulator
MEAIHGDKLRGHLETMVLSTLERGKAHGLEILHRLEQAGCGLLRLKEGSLYPALYRLEAAGQVKAFWEAEPHGRRGARRRIYRLTAKGQRKWPARPTDWSRLTILATFLLAGVMAAFSVVCAWVLVQTVDERRRRHEEWSRLPIEPYSEG